LHSHKFFVLSFLYSATKKDTLATGSYLQLESLQSLAKEPLKEEYLSQSGDIIVRLTAPYTAVLIDETTSGMVVSSNGQQIELGDFTLILHGKKDQFKVS